MQKNNIIILLLIIFLYRAVDFYLPIDNGKSLLFFFRLSYLIVSAVIIIALWVIKVKSDGSKSILPPTNFNAIILGLAFFATYILNIQQKNTLIVILNYFIAISTLAYITMTDTYRSNGSSSVCASDE